MKKLVEICINDAAHGDLIPLAGLIDWLIVDKGYSLKRLLRIADRYFGVPRNVALATLEYLA